MSEPRLLTRKVQTVLSREQRLGVSAISCWEIAMLVAKGRIAIDRPVDTWMAQALAVAKIELCPLTPKIAMLSASLDDFHGDPADRMIVATAMAAKATLITRDTKIRKAKLCPTTWD